MNSCPLVDFIGIGAPKCGSTWLFHALGQHPQVCLSEPKEVNYFNSVDFSMALHSKCGPYELVNVNSEKSIDWYGRHFRHCEPTALKGEFSPTYYCDRSAPQRIHRHYPNVRLIMCLRHPADCVHAIYWARRQYRKIEVQPTFEDAIRADERYLNYGYFAGHISRVLDCFDEQQLKFVFLEDIAERPEETLRSVFDFLNLDREVRIDFESIPKNSAKVSRGLSLEPLMKRFSRFMIDRNQAVLLHKIRNLGIKQAAMRISTVPSSYPAMRPETRRYLVDTYSDDLTRLAKIVRRDLDAWMQ